MSVRYELDAEVAIVTLDRPDVLNAIDQSITDGVAEALGRAGAEARVAVLTGAGKAFCAGADLPALLAEYGPDGPELERVIASRFNPLIQSVLAAEVPVIAAVNGVAAGAGMGLALACDLRVMASGGFLMSAFINVALIPDSGSAWFLPQMVGVSRAMEIAMTGRRVPAEEAQALGLVHRVVEPGELVEEAVAWARALADGPTEAYTRTRRLLRAAAGAALEATLDEEARVQGELGRLGEHLEGMRAFVEKRPPDFRSVSRGQGGGGPADPPPSTAG